jgi:hypothetical protein
MSDWVIAWRWRTTANRHRLAMELKAIDSSLDLSSSIKQLEDERAIIDAGFAKLKIAAAA